MNVGWSQHPSLAAAVAYRYKLGGQAAAAALATHPCGKQPLLLASSMRIIPPLLLLLLLLLLSQNHQRRRRQVG